MIPEENRLGTCDKTPLKMMPYHLRRVFLFEKFIIIAGLFAYVVKVGATENTAQHAIPMKLLSLSSCIMGDRSIGIERCFLWLTNQLGISLPGVTIWITSDEDCGFAWMSCSIHENIMLLHPSLSLNLGQLKMTDPFEFQDLFFSIFLIWRLLDSGSKRKLRKRCQQLAMLQV